MERRDDNGFIDTLLECLIMITKLKGAPFSAETLTAGLPLSQHRLTPAIFSRAAERAGLSSKVVKRPLSKINTLLLPAILILNNSEACLLINIDAESKTVQTIVPDAGEGTQTLSIDALEQQYSGFAIFVQSVYDFNQPNKESEHHIKGHWFWSTLWRYKSYYYQIGIAALFVNIFSVVISLFSMNVYDRVIPNNAFDTLWVLFIGITFILLFDLLLRILRHYLISISAQKADILLGSAIFRQILNMRMEVRPGSTGSFANDIHGYEALRDFFTSATITTLIDVPFVLLFLIIIAMMGSKLIFVMLVAILATLLTSYLAEIPTRNAMQTAYLANTKKHGLLVETLSNLETVKTQSGESRFQGLWEKCVGASSKATLHSQHYSGLASHMINFIMQMTTTCNILVGVYLISQGELSMGGLIACNFLSMRVLMPLSQISSMIARFKKSKIALDALDKIMAQPVERPDNVRFLNHTEYSGNISFHNVSFNYPGHKVSALHNISFHVAAGERVGLIGKIGSGKSTILKLILHLYSVGNGGSIRIDYTDIAQMDPSRLRKNIAYIAQDLSLFSGTVRENITMTVPWASDARILRAAQLAGVNNFVEKHPLGYDMLVGERGEGLSSGQRQAIMLARALLSDPPILLLDEPTSNMDNTSEQVFIKNLKMILPEKTLLLVTHKSGMLALVDRVIVMEEGKIVADGPKEKVLALLTQPKS